jgi:hypothetical protein
VGNINPITREQTIHAIKRLPWDKALAWDLISYSIFHETKEYIREIEDIRPR